MTVLDENSLDQLADAIADRVAAKLACRGWIDRANFHATKQRNDRSTNVEGLH